MSFAATISSGVSEELNKPDKFEEPNAEVVVIENRKVINVVLGEADTNHITIVNNGRKLSTLYSVVDEYKFRPKSESGTVKLLTSKKENNESKNKIQVFSKVKYNFENS